LPAVELITKGTINGEPAKHSGRAFAKVVEEIYRRKYSFEAALDLFSHHPEGVAKKYRGRLEKELRRIWSKIDHRKQSAFIISENGKPLGCLANAITAIRRAPEWRDRLAYDLFAERMVNDGGQWEEIDDIILAEWLQHHEVVVNPRIAQQAAFRVAFDNKFHPVRDYLNSLTWDGVKRLDGFLENYFGVRPSPVEAGNEEDTDRALAERAYHQAVGSKFIIGMVARVMRPGCKSDCAAVFEGPQGLLKSSALLALMHNDEWFTDQLADLGSKDAAMQLLGRLCVEWSELESMTRAEIGRVKAYMSTATDKYRPPYGQHVVMRPRQCAFAGTCNHSEYLRDETGGRRFWPAKCGKIDIEAIRRDRDQLWAEAYVRFQKGETWWLDDFDVVEQSKIEQEARRIKDPWEPKIAAAIERVSPKVLSIQLILEEVFFVHVERQDQIMANRVARCLTALGWERFQLGRETEITLLGNPFGGSTHVLTRRSWGYRPKGT
jgi:predicted P-loop ATPase